MTPSFTSKRRHLFFSVANWKNRRESFYHLRVVNQHQILFWLSVDPREGQMQNWFFAYGPSNMEKQAPGSNLIPSQFLPFYTTSPNFPFGSKESCWKCGGTGMELEELGWNRNRTRVPISPCSQYPGTDFSFWPTLPRGQKSPQRRSTLNDLPK